MSFLTPLLHNELKKIGTAVEPAITKTIIENIINERSNYITNKIIDSFINSIKNDINVNKNQKIKLLAVVKDAMKKDKTTNLYDELENLRLENTNLSEKLNQLQNSVKQEAMTVNQVGGADNDTTASTASTASTLPVAKLVGNLEDAKADAVGNIKGAATTAVGNTLDQYGDISSSVSAITDADKEMEAYVQNLKDAVAGGGLMKIVVDIIVKSSTEKIENGICKLLQQHKEKIVESAIRTFVNQIETDDDISDIEVGEIYKIIEKKLKKMDIEQLKKTKKSTFNKFKEGLKFNELKSGFSNEYNKFKRTVGGKKNTHRKKSKKLNRKTRRKRL